MVELDVQALSPLVLTAYAFHGPSFTGRLVTREVADFEVEFITEGGGSQLIDGIEYPMVAGDLVWRRPGTMTRGKLPYSCLAVALDLEGIRRVGREPYLLSRAKPLQPNFSVGFLEGILPITTPAEPEEYRRLFDALLRHFVNPGPGALVHLRSLALGLLARLSDDAHSHGVGAPLPQGAPVRLKKLIHFRRAEFHRRIVLDDLAREAGLSPTYLHSLFRQTLGITPREYLTRVRLAHARELLASTSLPAIEVALACGVDNVPYFFTLFRRRTGMTPGEFRLKHSPL